MSHEKFAHDTSEAISLTINDLDAVWSSLLPETRDDPTAQTDYVLGELCIRSFQETIYKLQAFDTAVYMKQHYALTPDINSINSKEQ